MSKVSTSERIAILLGSLGGNIKNDVLQQLPGNTATKMTSALERLEKIPPRDDEVTEVLEEFSRFMEFAISNSDSVLKATEAKAEPVAEEEFVSSGDPALDLANLADYQIAGALRSETGATCAVVLSQLATDQVGKVMALLPADVRRTAFLQLQAKHPIPKPLLHQILQTIVASASRLDRTAASDPDHIADERTARQLRSMDRNTRTEMLKALESEQPEVAERVKGLLFVFDDLLLVTDKSIQKLLSEVETTVLATALKSASSDIIERMTSNLSKRARAGLLEEIEFLDDVPTETEQDARKSICDVMARLDEAGELSMISKP